MAYTMEVQYYNAFWLKKVVEKGNISAGWPGLPWDPPGYPKFPFGDLVTPGEFAPPGSQDGTAQTWFIEEMQIKGGFNNTALDLGVKAYIVEEDINQQQLDSGLIYSGIYNARTGINQTNVFSVGESITKSLNPAYGSIQKLHASESDLIIFQENKVSNAQIDKNAIYSADGSPMKTQSNVVIGQVFPFLGEYGISKNPESFATFGYAKYFSDRYRGTICRLSRDGITEISMYGMTDYFRDTLAGVTDNWQLVTTATGTTVTHWGYFPYIKPQEYWIILNLDTGYNCCDIGIGDILSYSNLCNGCWCVDSWVTTQYYVTATQTVHGFCKVYLTGFPTDSPFAGPSPIFAPGDPLNPTFHTLCDSGTLIRFTKNVKSKIIGGWDIHNKNYVVSIQQNSGNYTTDLNSYDTVTFDERINGWSSFHTYKPTFVGSLKNKYYSFHNGGLYEHYYELPSDNNRGMYYGQREGSSITFVVNPQASVLKNFQTVNYEGSNGWQADYFKSGFEGADILPSGMNKSFQDESDVVQSYTEGEYVDPSDGITYRSGFYRKENRYVANLVSESAPRPGEVIIGPDGFGGFPISGIKGYFATVKLATDATTNLGGMKELFSVGSKYVVSSH